MGRHFLSLHDNEENIMDGTGLSYLYEPDMKEELYPKEENEELYIEEEQSQESLSGDIIDILFDAYAEAERNK